MVGPEDLTLIELMKVFSGHSKSYCQSYRLKCWLWLDRGGPKRISIYIEESPAEAELLYLQEDAFRLPRRFGLFRLLESRPKPEICE